ncbi:MAG: YdeI/OmpD-associated family protein [Thermoleophilia bacterium]|nr:YdeI/OmpD-associated family protein [Thermoleophilia bacterium]
MIPMFFPAPDDFRRWLARHRAGRDELWVGYYKKATGKPSMTWPESVDEALCYGWIDGIRKSIDDESYMIRFTPRRRGSNWSRVNLERVAALIEQARMRPAGMAAYEARDPEKSGTYSFELEHAQLSAAQRKEFKSRPDAWAFWKAQPPGYRKQATWWVVSAKREPTRARRLATLIEDSASGLRIKQLRRE